MSAKKLTAAYAAKNIALHTVLILIAVITIVPFFYAVVISFGENLIGAGTTIPKAFGFTNYRNLFTETKYLQWLLTSALVGAGTAAIALAVVSLAVYVLSRLKFYGKQQLFGAILLIQIFPLTLSMVSIFKIFAAFNLLNSIFGLIIADSVMASAGLVLLAKGYFDTIPYELDEAAMIDGANRMQILVKITLPLAKPMLTIIALQSFVLAYNEYAIANTILNTGWSNIPVALGLQSLMYEITKNWSIYCAGAVIATIPMLLLFYSLQKYFIGDLTEGGVKQ
jgi:arabinogalactan oligomer/maltooligosaccharide transport system permease protein